MDGKCQFEWRQMMIRENHFGTHHEDFHEYLELVRGFDCFHIISWLSYGVRNERCAFFSRERFDDPGGTVILRSYLPIDWGVSLLCPCGVSIIVMKNATVTLSFFQILGFGSVEGVWSTQIVWRRGLFSLKRCWRKWFRALFDVPQLFLLSFQPDNVDPLREKIDSKSVFSFSPLEQSTSLRVYYCIIHAKRQQGWYNDDDDISKSNNKKQNNNSNNEQQQQQQTTNSLLQIIADPNASGPANRIGNQSSIRYFYHWHYVPQKRR